MQTLNNIPDDYHLTKYFAQYYSKYSVKTLPLSTSCDKWLSRVFRLVNDKAGLPYSNSPTPFTYTQSVQSIKKRAFIAFSGGKDCLATAIMAKQDGYTPTLCYIRGVNKSLPSERKHAQQVASHAGFEYKELSITISGNKEWNEHPLKNILILCMLIDEGVKHGATAYAIGSSFDDDSKFGSLDFDLSDSFDMLYYFAFFVRKHFPQFKFMHYMCNTLQSFYTCYKYDKNIIQYLSTCITPDYRRPMIRKANISKYGADVMNADGCGGCYKCADEYLYKQKFGMVRTNMEYYNKCQQAKAQFDRHYISDFTFDKRKFNRYGGVDKKGVQVLCDRCGYYIGDLQFDNKMFKYFAHTAFGHHHYRSRAQAETILSKFKSLYKLE